MSDSIVADFITNRAGAQKTIQPKTTADAVKCGNSTLTEVLAAIDADLGTKTTINDNAPSANATYSSNKIEELIEQGGGGGGTTVVANPSLSGSEAELTGLQVGNTKYKVPEGGGGGTANYDALNNKPIEILEFQDGEQNGVALPSEQALSIWEHIFMESTNRRTYSMDEMPEMALFEYAQSFKLPVNCQTNLISQVILNDTITVDIPSIDDAYADGNGLYVWMIESNDDSDQYWVIAINNCLAAPKDEINVLSALRVQMVATPGSQRPTPTPAPYEITSATAVVSGIAGEEQTTEALTEIEQTAVNDFFTAQEIPDNIIDNLIADGRKFSNTVVFKEGARITVQGLADNPVTLTLTDISSHEEGDVTYLSVSIFEESTLGLTAIRFSNIPSWIVWVTSEENMASFPITTYAKAGALSDKEKIRVRYNGQYNNRLNNYEELVNLPYEVRGLAAEDKDGDEVTQHQINWSHLDYAPISVVNQVMQQLAAMGQPVSIPATAAKIYPSQNIQQSLIGYRIAGDMGEDDIYIDAESGQNISVATQSMGGITMQIVKTREEEEFDGWVLFPDYKIIIPLFVVMAEMAQTPWEIKQETRLIIKSGFKAVPNTQLQSLLNPETIFNTSIPNYTQELAGLPGHLEQLFHDEGGSWHFRHDLQLLTWDSTLPGIQLHAGDNIMLTSAGDLVKLKFDEFTLMGTAHIMVSFSEYADNAMIQFFSGSFHAPHPVYYKGDDTTLANPGDVWEFSCTQYKNSIYIIGTKQDANNLITWEGAGI